MKHHWSVPAKSPKSPARALRFALGVSIAALLAQGCDGGVKERTNETEDTMTQTDVSGGDQSADVSMDTEMDVEEPNASPGTYSACSADGDCPNGSCVEGVCVSDPTDPSYITVEDSGGVVEFEDIAPEIGCYAADGIFDPNDGVDPAPTDQTVTVWGDIDSFGPAPATTRDVCVTIYDHERLLKHFEKSACNDMDISQEQVDCFRADPCRCDALMGAEQTECYAQIGLCDKLSGGDKASCEAALPDGKPLIYGYGTTVCEDGDGNSIGCTEEGVRFYFRIPNIPVNRNLVVKTSGAEFRWIDTFEYGALIPWNKVDIGKADPVTGEADSFKIAANAISTSAWDTIPSTAGLARPIDKLTKGAIAGRMKDCGLEGRSEADPTYDDLDISQPMVHATIGLANPPSTISYFNGNPDDTLPQPGRVDANLLGVYAGLDVPYGRNAVSVRVELPDPPSNGDCDGNTCNGGHRKIFLIPHSVVIATFEGAYKEVE